MRSFLSKNMWVSGGTAKRVRDETLDDARTDEPVEKESTNIQTETSETSETSKPSTYCPNTDSQPFNCDDCYERFPTHAGLMCGLCSVKDKQPLTEVDEVRKRAYYSMVQVRDEQGLPPVKGGYERPSYGVCVECGEYAHVVCKGTCGPCYNKQPIPFSSAQVQRLISYGQRLLEEPDGNTLAQCQYEGCGKWFQPYRTQVTRRLVDYDNDGSRLYCSDDCKQSCSIFGKSATSLHKDVVKGANDIPDRGSEEYQVWRTKVLQLDYFQCASCGSKNHLHAHHIQPWATNPGLRFDPANGITLCSDCHNRYGHDGDEGCYKHNIRKCAEEHRRHCDEGKS